MNAPAKTAITLGGLGIVALAALFLRPQPKSEWDGVPIPEEGLVLNPAGKNLCDPDNAVKDFKRVYAAMDAYRRTKGTLPSLKDLTDFEKPLAGGIRLTVDDFSTPDAQYADGYVPGQKNLSYMFSYIQPRPDGRPKPAFPATGEKDVWLVSTDYVRRNQRVYQDHHSDLDFRGEYVVLWSDGEVEKIPVDGAAFVALSKNADAMSFPGQAGMPKKTKSLGDVFGGAREGKNNIKVNGA